MKNQSLAGVAAFCLVLLPLLATGQEVKPPEGFAPCLTARISVAGTEWDISIPGSWLP